MPAPLRPLVFDAARSLPHAAARLASLLGEGVLDRLPGSDRLAAGQGAGAVPRRATALDAEGLERLVRRRHPRARVAEIELLSTDAGTTERARVAVRWKTPPEEPGAAPPESLFVKCAPADFATRYFVDLMDLGRSELDFYRSLRGRTTVDAPRCFAAEEAPSGRRFVLVLEDLAAEPDCRFGAATLRLDLEGTRCALRTLARLHGDFWQKPRNEPALRWLKDPRSNPRAPLERLLSQLTFEPALGRYGALFPEFVHAHGRRVLDARSRLEAIWAEGPVTVLHGDAHAGNLYQRGMQGGGPRSVGFLDWQVVQVGQPMRDVTYLLINAADPDVVDVHEESLVRGYLEALGEAGGEPPAYDVAYEQLRGHVFYVMISVLVTAASATMQSRSVIESAIRALSKALERTDPLGWLRDRGLA